MSSHPTLPLIGSQRAAGLQILRPDTYARLTRALDDAVAADPMLAPAAAAVLAPLRRLAAMAQEAEGALGDDVLAAERLLTLVALSAADIPTAALQGLSDLVRTHGTPEGAEEHTPLLLTGAARSATPCEPALIDLGALVILGLAAGRVGAPLGLGAPLASTVFELALAASPAEIMVRALAVGLAPQQIQAILSGLTPRDDGNGGFAPLLAGLLADRCERARWESVRLLGAHVAADIAQMEWDAATSDEIVAVAPADACSGDLVTIGLETALTPDGDDVATVHGASLLTTVHVAAELPEDQPAVVFASAGQRSIAQPVERVDVATGIVETRVPPGARSGWIGFFDRDALERTNTAREQLRASWQQRNETLACLRSAPVPTSAIAVLPEPPTPPRTAVNRFAGGEPVVEASLTPDVVDIGGSLELQWHTAGAHDVAIEPPVAAAGLSGSARITAGPEHARISRTITGTNRCGQSTSVTVAARVRARIDTFRLVQDGHADPLIEGQPLEVQATISPPDNTAPVVLVAGQWVHFAHPVDGAITIVVPGSVVRHGLLGTLRVLAPANQFDDERTFGPLRLSATQQRTIVLLRPAIIGRTMRRVSMTDVEAGIAVAARQNAQHVTIVEPAWVDDDDITCHAPPDGPDVPETLRLLERLNVLAACHPGREDALWLALVPAPARGQGFHCVQPAEGARAVAVATPDQLDALLATQLPGIGARTQRLRVIGSIGTDGSVRLEHLRVEERAAGTGAPVTTDLSLFGLAGPAIRAEHPLRLMSRARPARIVALMPVTADMDNLVIARSEYESGDDFLLLRRVSRTAGGPDVKAGALADGTLSWQYVHSRNARSQFTVEVGNGDAWSPIAVVGGCSDSVQLPLSRIAARAGARRVRVIASDGWNTDASRSLRLPELPAMRALIRSAGPRRLWADVDGDELDSARVVWTFHRDVSTASPIRVTGTIVTPPAGFTGRVVLTIDGEKGGIIDERRIINGVAQDRSLFTTEGTAHA